VTTLYWADPSDDTHATIGLDLNGLAAGDPTGFQLIGLDWGDIDPEVTWHSDGSVPGAEQIRNHPGPVEAGITLLADFSGTDYETLLETYRTLAGFFDSEGVLVWQPDGQSYQSYIDTYPSPIPALFRGSDKQGLRILEQLLDEGYTFRLWRHPYPRRAAVVLLDAVTLSNAVGDNVATFTNPGSALSEARLEIQVPSSDWITQVRAGFRAGDSLDFASTLSGFAITAATVRDYWKRIERRVLTPADPDSFAGTYRVVATMQLADDIFHLALHHGATRDDDQPLANENEEVPLDGTDISNFDPYVEVDLGLVTYDPESPSLVLEIHAYSEGDTDMGDWGNVYLIPADEGAFLYSSPGYRSGNYGLEVYKGVLLELTGGADLEDDDDVMLDALGANAEVKPTAGQTLPVGPHVLAFHGSVHNRQRTKQQIAKMEIEKNGSVSHTIALQSKKGRPTTHYNWDEFVRRIDFRVTDDTDVYRFWVEQTTFTSALRWARVVAIRHHYVPPITDSRRLVVDAGTREARIEDPDGARVASLRATGLPFLEPGDGALAITLGEVASHGYSHVDERMVLPKIDPAVAAQVTLIVVPRDLHP
jgi:hypothetical protein